VSLQQIPLTNSPNQQLTASLTVDGAPLTLNLGINYAEMTGYWLLSITDANNNLLIASVPMICGGYPAANLLKQQRYLGIGSAYLVNASNLAPGQGGSLGYGAGDYGGGAYGGDSGQGGSDYPNSTNLGTDFQLWWGDTPTV